MMEEAISELSNCGGVHVVISPRTIPFRSASFSQVDITSDGKYVRNPRSPITLKPTAFCLLNNSYSSGSTTLPRSYTLKSKSYSSSSSSSTEEPPPSYIPSSSSASHNNKSTSIINTIKNHSQNTNVPLNQLTGITMEPTSSETNVTPSDCGDNSSATLNLQMDNNSQNSSLAENTTENETKADPVELTMSAQKQNNEQERHSQTTEISNEKTRVQPHGSGLGCDVQDKCEEMNKGAKGEDLASSDGSRCENMNKACAPPTAASVADSVPPEGHVPLENKTGTASANVSVPLESIPMETECSAMIRSSSEEGPPEEDCSPKRGSQKRLLSGKSLHFDLDIHREGIGGGSSVSGSGGEDNDNEKEKCGLFRQSSGQSDVSDEIPPMTSSDQSYSSPPIETIGRGRSSLGIAIDPSVCPLTAALALDSSLSLKNSAIDTTGGDSTTTSFSAPTHHTHHHHSAPLTNKKEISRANSVSSPNFGGSSCVGVSSNRSLPPRRYKRPLRGPYGEMLEAEMNKLIPSRSTKEYDNFEFFRESKSSSPNRSPPGDPIISTAISTPKLTNSILMASMDDLNLTKQSKHANPRSRKISANLPVLQSSHPHYSTTPCGENTTSLMYHQRTASSPSQLLYGSSDTSTREDQNQRRLLNGSPRGHILAEIVDTEKSYVESLRILVKKYMEPLKTSDFIDSGLVDEIFFQIPAILWHHERLFEALQKRVIDDTQCVGDVLLDTFRQISLLECYSLFVNNWKNAKGSLKMAVASKPSLARFLEANARQHKGKLSLDSLLIGPIQRIPRYELLVKELLKHTKPTHEDHSRLTLVLEKIKKFAVHIDCASVDPNDNREIEIEGWGSGLGHLVRQDIVTQCTSSNVKKWRALFLFADSLVIASIKGKGGRKPSSSLSHNSAHNLEGCKFKLLTKIALTDVHLLNEDTSDTGVLYKSGSSGGSGSGNGGGSSGRPHEEMDDLKTIHKMMDLAAMLKCPHVGLDDILREIASGLKQHNDNNQDAIEFEIKSSDNSDSQEVWRILLGSVEKRNCWLESFQDTLEKFIRYGFGKLPHVQFLQALPIRKTRAGLQLSCASPVSLHNKASKTQEMSDVWVANSDGYVGQICILTLHPEPAITSCNGVCNSRITCIVSVPPSPPPAPTPPMHPHLAVSHSQHDSHRHLPHHHSHAHFHSLGYESEDDSHKNRSGHKNTEHWSVWLGTEDGCLHVYDCSDSVRVKKNRHKVQHKSPLNCIVYFDSRVFVSLGNGDVAVYSRTANGKGWSVSDPSWVTIGSGINPVTKMICINNQIWCACGSQMKVYGEIGGMLELLQSVQVTVDGNQMPRGISTIVATEDQVWVAVQASPILKCYNNSTYESLFEANIAHDVSKILTGCDDIIRQHKSACLRITALLMAPDKTLWIGTSAGVILTLSPIDANHKVTPLCHGHTGQVRFLTCCTTRESCTIISGGDGYEEFRPITPLFNNNNTSFSSMVNSLMGESSMDISGREDSTNHLLIWKIPKQI